MDSPQKSNRQKRRQKKKNNWEKLRESPIVGITTMGDGSLVSAPVMSKALGGRLGRRIGGGSSTPQDMNPMTARDSDLDGMVLEGIATVRQGRGVPDPTPGGEIAGMMAREFNPEEFVGTQELLKKHFAQFAKFQEWTRNKDWNAFHRNHFDWWMFPIPKGSNTYRDEYNVAGEPLEQLKNNMRYMATLPAAMRMYLRSIGWDLDAGKWIENAEVDRGQEPLRSLNSARLLKIAQSAEAHELTRELRSVSNMVNDLRRNGVAVGNNQYWDGISGRMAKEKDIDFNKDFPTGLTRRDFGKTWEHPDGTLYAFNGNPNGPTNGWVPASSFIDLRTVEDGSKKGEKKDITTIDGSQIFRFEWTGFEWKREIKKGPKKTGGSSGGGLSSERRLGRSSTRALKPGTKEFEDNFARRDTEWDWRDEAERMEILRAHQKGRNSPGTPLYDTPQLRADTDNVLFSDLWKFIRPLGLWVQKKKGGHEKVGDSSESWFEMSSTPGDRHSATNALANLLQHVNEEINPESFYTHFENWIRNPYSVMENSKGQIVGVRLALNDDKDALLTEYRKRVAALYVAAYQTIGESPPQRMLDVVEQSQVNDWLELNRKNKFAVKQIVEEAQKIVASGIIPRSKDRLAAIIANNLESTLDEATIDKITNSDSLIETMLSDAFKTREWGRDEDFFAPDILPTQDDDTLEIARELAQQYLSKKEEDTGIFPKQIEDSYIDEFKEFVGSDEMNRPAIKPFLQQVADGISGNMGNISGNMSSSGVKKSAENQTVSKKERSAAKKAKKLIAEGGSNKDIEAAIKKAFAGVIVGQKDYIDDTETNRGNKFNIVPLTVEVTDTGVGGWDETQSPIPPNKKRIEISGQIFPKHLGKYSSGINDENSVGFFMRVMHFDKDTAEVEHRWMEVKGFKTGAQQLGIATALNARNEEIYRELGISEISLYGSSMGSEGKIGASHWARNGYYWYDENEKNKFLNKLSEDVRNVFSGKLDDSNKKILNGIRALINKSRKDKFGEGVTPEELLAWDDEGRALRSIQIRYRRVIEPTSSAGNISGNMGNISGRMADPPEKDTEAAQLGFNPDVPDHLGNHFTSRPSAYDKRPQPVDTPTEARASGAPLKGLVPGDYHPDIQEIINEMIDRVLVDNFHSQMQTNPNYYLGSKSSETLAAQDKASDFRAFLGSWSARTQSILAKLYDWSDTDFDLTDDQKGFLKNYLSDEEISKITRFSQVPTTYTDRYGTHDLSMIRNLIGGQLPGVSSVSRNSEIQEIADGLAQRAIHSGLKINNLRRMGLSDRDKATDETLEWWNDSLAASIVVNNPDEEIGRGWDSLTDDVNVSVGMTLEGLLSMFRDGEFKTLFETKTSSGNINVNARQVGEFAMFGILPSYRGKRPAYGVVNFGPVTRDTLDRTNQYGPYVIVLKKDINKNVTWTESDSLSLMSSASSLDSPSQHSLFQQRLLLDIPFIRATPSMGRRDNDGATDGPDAIGQFQFTEAQIHQAISVDDIAHIIVDSDPWYRGDRTAFPVVRENGLPISEREQDYEEYERTYPEDWGDYDGIIQISKIAASLNIPLIFTEELDNSDGEEKYGPEYL
jgi:hypothetical protein